MSALHQHTPAISAVDPRGLVARHVAYVRSSADEARSEARVQRQGYDAAGHIVALHDARLSGPNQRMVVSLSGTVLHTDNVDAGWRLQLHGDAGQALWAWDGRGHRFRTEYDDQLRPVAQFEQASGSDTEQCVERWVYGGVEATHNRCGRIAQHDDPAGSRCIDAYDLHGVPQSETRRFLASLGIPHWTEAEDEHDAMLEEEACVTQWRRDATGALLAQTDACGHMQKHGYTVAGELGAATLTLVGARERTLARDIVYDAFGEVQSQTLGNEVLRTAGYDPATGRPMQWRVQHAGKMLQDLHYAYDPVGNVVSIEDATVSPGYWRNRRVDGVSTYRYDTLYQLIEATGREHPQAVMGPGLPLPIALDHGDVLTPYKQTYGYDAGGNLTDMRHRGEQSYTRRMAVSPTSNRSRSWPQGEPTPEIEAGFDANGNQRELERGQAMRWDARNQLQQVVQIARAEGVNDAEIYRYGGDGLRVRKVRTWQAKAVEHRQEVRYLPGLELRSNSATDERMQVVTLSLGRVSMQVLHWESGRPGELQDDLVHYQCGDHLGSVALVLDDQAQLVGEEGYYPYGGTAWRSARNEVEADYRTIRYSNKERDATGLYYYGFRYYAPWLLRWMNPDPAGYVDGLNLYRMVQNNPATLADTLGLSPSGWLTFSDDGKEIELDTEELRTLFENDEPKIIISGDGHSKPPLEFSRHIQGIMKSYGSGKLNVWVEGAPEEVKNNVSRFLPGHFKVKSYWKRGVNLVGWEHEHLEPPIRDLSEIIMNDIIGKGKQYIDEEEKHVIGKLKSDIIGQLVEEGVDDLALEFSGAMDDFINSPSKGAGRLITFLSGGWRDEFVNPYLARKMADEAGLRKKESFLISMGDAHLNVNPVQAHLVKRARDFPQKIIFNKARHPSIPWVAAQRDH